MQIPSTEPALPPVMEGVGSPLPLTLPHSYTTMGSRGEILARVRENGK